MFQLDDKFLEDIGLNQLPEEQKKPFLQHIYGELEMRVGTKLSDGMNDAQLAEFESIIDQDGSIVSRWLDEHNPNYYNDDAFLQLKEDTGLDINDPRLRAEYAATIWLEINRPDYRDVVMSVMNEIKAEITTNRDVILDNKTN